MPKIEIQNYYKGGVTPDATASDNDKLTKQRYYTFRISISLMELKNSKIGLKPINNAVSKWGGFLS